MKKIGLVINPIAGMGGRVGLKGTDGREVLLRAKELGATPQANEKTKLALKNIALDGVLFVTPPKQMGQDVCLELGLNYVVLDMSINQDTTPEDTIQALKLMMAENVDLIVFSGGDGTARLVAEIIGDTIPVIGIPAGVKIHSSVYAVRPSAAGDMIRRFGKTSEIKTSMAEVMDIDEELYRQGVVSTKLYGYVLTPSFEQFQKTKAGGGASDKATTIAIARTVVNQMSDNTVYLIGPGSTTVGIMELLNLPYTLLGFDVVHKGELIFKDACENVLLKAKQMGPIKVVLSIIGGQGYLLGRGNQQLSPTVLRGLTKDDFIVIATPDKIIQLAGQPLLVDSGSETIDKLLRGYHKVLVGAERYYSYSCE